MEFTTIERVFADAKEKHAIRYIFYRGLDQVSLHIWWQFCETIWALGRSTQPNGALYTAANPPATDQIHCFVAGSHGRLLVLRYTLQTA